MSSDSRELADKHFEEHRSSSWVPEEKMGLQTRSAASIANAVVQTGISVDTVGQHSSGEVRVTDPTTGGQKGSKLERFDLIPEEFETALARHYGEGAKKYEDRNWEKGYRWSLSIAALRRHLASWLRGESNDPETGSNHLIAVAWHAIALYIFELRGLGTDDIRRER